MEIMRIIGKILYGTSDKIIIISRWVFMLSIIGKFLRDDNIKYAEVTYTVVSSKRQSIIDKFNHINNERVSIFLTCIHLTMYVAYVGHLLYIDNGEP